MRNPVSSDEGEKLWEKGKWLGFQVDDDEGVLNELRKRNKKGKNKESSQTAVRRSGRAREKNKRCDV